MTNMEHNNPLNADPNLYVLQDSRSNADHQTLFWSKGGAGYTTDLNKAHLFTEEEAAHQNKSRSSDIPHRVGDLTEGMRLTVEDTMLSRATYVQRNALLYKLEVLATDSNNPPGKNLAVECHKQIVNSESPMSVFEARSVVRENGLSHILNDDQPATAYSPSSVAQVSGRISRHGHAKDEPTNKPSADDIISSLDNKPSGDDILDMMEDEPEGPRLG